MTRRRVHRRQTSAASLMASKMATEWQLRWQLTASKMATSHTTVATPIYYHYGLVLAITSWSCAWRYFQLLRYLRRQSCEHLKRRRHAIWTTPHSIVASSCTKEASAKESPGDPLDSPAALTRFGVSIQQMNAPSEKLRTMLKSLHISRPE